MKFKRLTAVLFAAAAALAVALPASAETFAGDADNNGQVNVSDIAALASHLKGIHALDGAGMENADVNKDNDLDVSDISIIAAHIKGIRAIGDQGKKNEEPKGPQIVEKDGVTYVDGILIVNKSYSLPSWYGNGITDETYAAYEQMRDAAWNDGIDLTIASGFRSYDYQNTLYNNYVYWNGQAEADTYSARPGHSEHQTGLAMDLIWADTRFNGSWEAQWIEDHCADYGFIIRYPRGKEDKTGFIYESWHVRYVGKDLARKITDSGLCLEEYLGIDSYYH